ncbi:hypothetical protein RFI_22660, partial [Reticulomyxa filosa]
MAEKCNQKNEELFKLSVSKDKNTNLLQKDKKFDLFYIYTFQITKNKYILTYKKKDSNKICNNQHNKIKICQNSKLVQKNEIMHHEQRPPHHVQSQKKHDQRVNKQSQ